MANPPTRGGVGHSGASITHQGCINGLTGCERLRRILSTVVEVTHSLTGLTPPRTPNAVHSLT